MAEKRIAMKLLRAVTIAALACCCARIACAQKWERIGPEGGNVLSLAVTGDGEVLLGTADGHVFASADGGEHWELRGRAGRRFDGVVQALIADVQVKTRVYAAVWTQDPAAGGGVYRSDDAGRTWTGVGLQGEAVRALAQSVSKPELFVAGTKTGVFRSEDAGKNWARISPAGDEELKNLDSIAIDPRDANVVYVGTYHLPWKTTDGGKSWKPIAAGMIDDSDVMSVVIDRTNPERVFASACSGIYRSENGGAQWTKLQGIPYVSRRTQQIAQDPTHAAIWYAGTTEGLWRSEDGGESWTRATGRDVVVNAIAFSGAGEKLLLGTEDGMLASTDSAKSFLARNSGFMHPVLRAFAVNETDSRLLLIAIERDGSGLLESTDGGKSWRTFPSPTVVANQLFSVSGNWHASLRGGGAARFDLKAKKWKEIRFVVRETVRNSGKNGGVPTKQTRERIVRPEVSVLCAAGGRLFAATSDGLWVSGVRSEVMQRVAEKQISGKIAAFATNTAASELFVISRNRIGRSTDSGKTWNWMTAPENTGELLWVKPADVVARKTMLVGARNGIFEYEYEAEWGEKKDWKLLQAGLPAAASWDAALGDRLWITSMRAGGVFVSRDAGRNWQRWEVEGGGVAQDVVLAGSRGAWVKTQTDGLFWVGAEAP